jgi:hypothetical protein
VDASLICILSVVSGEGNMGRATFPLLPQGSLIRAVLPFCSKTASRKGSVESDRKERRGGDALARQTSCRLCGTALPRRSYAWVKRFLPPREWWWVSTMDFR